MSNLIGKTVLVNDPRMNEAFFAMVIDQDLKRGTVTVLDQNDDCFELLSDLVTFEVDAA